MKFAQFFWLPTTFLLSRIMLFSGANKFMLFHARCIFHARFLQINSSSDLCSHCDGSVPALNHLDYQSDEKGTSLWDRDRLGNDPQWVPGFLNRCSWMFPEQLRNKSELVGSEEIHQA